MIILSIYIRRRPLNLPSEILYLFQNVPQLSYASEFFQYLKKSEIRTYTNETSVEFQNFISYFFSFSDLYFNVRS